MLNLSSPPLSLHLGDLYNQILLSLHFINVSLNIGFDIDDSVRYCRILTMGSLWLKSILRNLISKANPKEVYSCRI